MKRFIVGLCAWTFGLGSVLTPTGMIVAQTQRDVDAANKRASALYDQGLSTRAVEEFKRAIELAQRVYGPNHPNVQRVRSNLARAYGSDSQYDKAELLFRDVISKLQSFYQSGRGNVDAKEFGTVLLNFGAFYGDLGQYAEALKWTGAALKVYESGGWSGPASMARVNLGNLYGLMGEYDKALEQYHLALRFRKKQFGDNDSRTSDVVVKIGAVYAARRDFVEAERCYRHGLTVREAQYGRDSDEYGLSYLGGVLLELGRFEEAEALYRRIHSSLGKRFPTDHHTLAQNRSRLALCAAYRGRWDEAVRLMDQSRRQLRPIYARVAAGLSESEQLTKLREYTGEELQEALSLGWARRGDAKATECAAGWLLNSKGLIFEAMANRTLLQRDARLTGLNDVVEQLRAVRRQLAALSQSDPEKVGRDSYVRRFSELLEQEARLSRRLGAAGGRQPVASNWVEARAVRRALPPDTVFVDIARVKVRDYADKGGPAGLKSEDRYLAWVMTATEGMNAVDLGSTAEVEALARKLLGDLNDVEKRRAEAGAELKKLQSEKIREEEKRKRIDELFRKLSAAEGELEKGFRATAAELSKRILHPLLSHAAKATRWVISPDAELWLVPWAALILPDGQYFAERLSLRQVISGRDLLAGAGPVATGRPLVMANPNYSRGVTAENARPYRQVPLPAIQRMAERILPYLKKLTGAEPEVYFGDRATEEVVKAARSPRLVLLGTHGLFGGVDPRVVRPGFGFLMENPLLRCLLTFAGCDRQPQPGDTVEDGLLLGVEVLGCDFRGTELVVLAACQTARGDIHAGQAAVGMRSAFLLAGARSVEATLWSVDVQATVVFTEGLFERLADGRPVDDALVESQRAVIARWRQERGSAHPFYWAAYTLTGVGL